MIPDDAYDVIAEVLEAERERQAETAEAKS